MISAANVEYSISLIPVYHDKISLSLRVNAAEAEETKQSSNAISKSMKILSDNFEKVKKDLIQIREYVDHWKKQFDLAKREHSSLILKNDSAPQ